MQAKVDLEEALSSLAHVVLIEKLGTPSTGDSTERDPAPEVEL